MPQRIQRRRTRGWRLPSNAVIVDRTSRFGNPFSVAGAIDAGHTNPQRACVSHFRAWLAEQHPDYGDIVTSRRKRFDRRWILANLHLLRGKDLCCPCAPGQPCHVDVYLDLLANEGDQPREDQVWITDWQARQW